MAISRSTASRLCTGRELELVEASYPTQLKQLSPARLRQKAVRARTLRDKYRDLAKRQRLESRDKAEPRRSRPARGHENTDRKAELFAEVLQRFQRQLGADASTPAKKATGQEARKVAAESGRKRAQKGGKKGAKSPGANKSAARSAGSMAPAEIGSSPAGGRARPAPPGRPGAAAPKGARQRADAKQQARAKTARAHHRAAGSRSQKRRDNR